MFVQVIVTFRTQHKFRLSAKSHSARDDAILAALEAVIIDARSQASE
jgi:hypothetical protein